MKKITIFLDDAEERLVLNALTLLRNDLIRDGKHTDFADDLIMKIADAPLKRVKIK